MVTLKDITGAINLKLKEKFPNIKRETKDISEGFERPSFFVSLDNSSKSSFMDLAVERSATVRILYFASSRTESRIELLEVQESLEELFNHKITIKDDFMVEVNEMNTEKFDNGAIEFSFDIYYIEELNDNDDTELIEELEVNINN